MASSSSAKWKMGPLFKAKAAEDRRVLDKDHRTRIIEEAEEEFQTS